MDAIPFDVDAFRKGATALLKLDTGTVIEVLFFDECLTTIYTNNPRFVIDKSLFARGLYAASHWTMKPPKQDDGWIPVLDGKCPKEIEGANAFEWEYHVANGPSLKANADAASSFWNWAGSNRVNGGGIVAVRLIKKDRECPSERIIKDCLIGELLGKHETAQQTRTREAYARYKAKHPDPSPFRALGENAMNKIAAAALEKLSKQRQGN